MDDPRASCSPQTPENCTPIPGPCEPPFVLACWPRGCACIVSPPPLCNVTISYPSNDPANVFVTLPQGEACAATVELALAALLARLLAN